MSESIKKIKECTMRFFSKPFFSDKRALLSLYILLPVIAALMKLNQHNNNFAIFRGVFHHTINQTSLYAAYPDEYYDYNYYGPLFSLVIAPFAVLSPWVGLLCWLLALSITLYLAIRYLPFDDRKKVFVYWFCAHELLTALFMSQFNIAIATTIIVAFYCINKEKDVWAAFMIMFGTFIKLYSIVGLAFFFFSKHKPKFIMWLIIWAAVFFVAPMLISSPDYIISQYAEWAQRIVAKNDMNLFTTHQNVSLLGIIRKVSHCATYSDMWIILAGLAAFGCQYLRPRQFQYSAFQYAILASTLMFVVLFSTGSESSSYIIAFVGVALWYWSAPWKRSKTDVFLMIFAFILTSMSPSDLFPSYLRKTFVHPYALKALPVSIIWIKLLYETYTRNYQPLQPTGEK